MRELILEKSRQILEQNQKLIPDGKTFAGTTLFDQGETPFSFVKGKGGEIWDVDGNQYTDYILSLGSVSLGYNYPEVDKAIADQLANGVSFSLPHQLEMDVAQKLVEMIPCAETVKYGKNGSDALSAGLRLARQITGREHIMTCGFHGCRDWSIAQTSKNSGIPEDIRALTHRFRYNDIEDFKRIVSENKNQIACVIMDVVARYSPNEGYLEEIRAITKEEGILLIFDEVVTGFRMHPGGASGFYGVTPDFAAFGKGIANGMPLSVLAGPRELMEHSSQIFYSLTAAGETLSLAAASAALDIFKNQGVAEHLAALGESFIGGFRELIKTHGLEEHLNVEGMPSRPIVGIKTEDHLTFQQREAKVVHLLSFLARHFAEHGILYNGSIFFCYSHTQDNVKRLLQVWDETLPTLKKMVRG